MSRNRKTRDELEATPLNINELIIIRDHVYQIPRFQRSYCWDESNIKMLWEDIDSLMGDEDVSTRFLGAIILKDYLLAGGQRFPIYDVIDGQQRLITFFMLLCVVTHTAWHRAKTLAETGEDSDAKTLAAELMEYAEVTAEGLICRSGRDKGKSKIVPSFIDMPEFNWALDHLDFLSSSVKRFPLAGDLKAVGSLETAVELIGDHLKSRVDQSLVGVTKSEQDYAACRYLNKTLTIVLQELELIEVILAERHDANEVFDRLNLQGQELTVLDLIRNEFFRVFGADDESAIDFYKNKWLPFEEQFVTPLLKTRDEENLSAFAKAVAKHKSGFWYPFALTLDPDCTSSKKRIFETLRGHWSKIKATTPKEKATNILMQLNAYVPIYNAITLGIRPKNVDAKGKIWDRVSRLHEYNIPAGTYVYLFQLVKAGFDTNKSNIRNDIVKCLDLVESYIMRRAFCKDDGSVKNVFNPIWRMIRYDPRLLNYQLHDKNRPYYSNTEVIDALTGEDKSNFYALKGRAKFALVEYERSLPGDNVDFDKFTLDHVMPQSREPHWTHISSTDHENNVDKIGNLVVLTKRSNSSKSNRTWQDTAKLFKDESATKSPRKIANKKNWRIADIKSRSKSLAEWAVDKRWKKPPKPSGKLGEELRKRMEYQQKDAAKKLAKLGIQHAFIRKTKTGFTKGNITASVAFQEYVKSNNYHDYSKQGKGEEHSVRLPVEFVHEDWSQPAEMTMYRTKTKGECRVWPAGLNAYSGQWSILALHIDDKGLAKIVNCSNENIFEAFLSSYGD